MDGEKQVVHLIANAHLDPLWLWSWPEGLAEGIATCRAMTELMKDYPEATFARGEYLVYRWIEQVAPDLFSEIQRLVEEGRWEIVNGWYVQPDCNLPHGEGFVRQALYGKRYFRQKFGVEVDVGYCVDSFGHNAGMPQIYRKSGYRYFVFFRPGTHEKELPGCAFLWEGVDGSRILTCRPPTMGYIAVDKAEMASRLPAIRDLMLKKGLPGILFYGVGDHGGGATRELLEGIRELQAEYSDLELRCSRVRDFFQEVENGPVDALPVVNDELQHHAVGCYTAHSETKRLNRATEHLILNCEKLCAMDWFECGGEYPLADLQSAWESLLFNQFHDVLAGSSLETAYEDVRDIFGHARAVAQTNMCKAIQRVADMIDTQGEGIPVVLFNPHSFPFAGPLSVELMLDYRPEEGGEATTLLVRDSEGRTCRSQEEELECLLPVSWRRRVTFEADVPPLGYRLFFVLPADQKASGGPAGQIHAAENSISNGLLELRRSGEGLELEVLDGGSRGNIVRPVGDRAIVFRDTSDTWSHGVERYTEQEGRFEIDDLKCDEPGPYVAKMRVKSHWGRWRMEQEFILYAGQKRLECRTAIFWEERLMLLKLPFGFSFDRPRFTYQIPYGALTREATGNEEPGQQWVAVEGTRWGAGIVNDSKYGYSAVGGELRITALRCTAYAWSGDERQPETYRYPRYMDEGQQRLTYWVLPYEGGWAEAGLPAAAEALVNPPVALVTHCHSGRLPQEHSLLQVDTEAVTACAVKKSEDGDELVLRLFNSTGTRQAAILTVSGVLPKASLKFGPYELRTLAVDREKGTIREVTLLEEPA